MNQNKCECCDRDDQPIAGVACSALGAFSLRYCKECLTRGAEPKGMIQFTVEQCDGLQNIRKEVLESVTYYENGKYVFMKDFK